MLPDIPKTKTEISNLLMTALKRRVEADHPILTQIRSITQHEGRAHEYEQIGFGKVLDTYREIEVPVTIALDDIPHLVGERLTQKLSELSDEMGKQQMQMFFHTLDETIEKAGNKVQGDGGPITADKLLQMMEMTQVDFDRRGRPTSTFVMHPEMMATAKKIDEQIKNDPELKARADAIQRKHYESWLARESNRKLVD